MNKLFVEASPHIRSPRTTKNIMLDVIIALCPALVASIVIFGYKAAVLTAVCVASCVLFEFLFNKIVKKPGTVSDLSAIVTGMLLSFNLPVDLPIYMAVIGCFVAIVIVKCLFGGIGQNFANPAITARIVLMLSFTAAMTTWAEPLAWFKGTTDAVSTATPLGVISSGEGTLPSLLDMLLGVRGGCLGETCVAALLLGGLYLIFRGVIRPITPICFIGTVALLSFFKGGFDINYVAYQVMGGGLILGAFFMATDYSTTPITDKGKVIFAVGCGVITFLIREFANYPEGVSFSILVMNCLTPLIDRFTSAKPFGAIVPKKEGKKE